MSGDREISFFYLRLAALLIVILFGTLAWAMLRSPTPRSATAVLSPAPTNSAPPPTTSPATVPEPASAPIEPPVTVRSIDPELAAAAAKMVLPPPGTPLAYAADPRALSTTMHRGLAIYESAPSDSHRLHGARLIQLAAVLGFEPARSLITRNYPRSRVMREATAAPDAIRYALDVFAASAAPAGDAEPGLIALARHFAYGRELETFATHVVEAIRDDRRLQVPGRVDLVLAALRRVPEACAAIGRVASSSAAAVDCAPPLNELMLTHVRNAGPVGRDHNSRRQALVLLQEFVASR
jgi:hypothetical protein